MLSMVDELYARAKAGRVDHHAAVAELVVRLERAGVDTTEILAELLEQLGERVDEARRRPPG